jgi:purine-binding chemotaxis protein CheW
LKYLSFMLADQLCAIELSCARELLGYMPFTPDIAEHPAVAGWFDLRGRRVRVVDLRIRFGLPVTRTDDTVMVVIELGGETVAAIADNVIGLEKPAEILPVGSGGQTRVDPHFLIGVANVSDRTMLVLDVARSVIIPPPIPKAA